VLNSSLPAEQSIAATRKNTCTRPAETSRPCKAPGQPPRSRDSTTTYLSLLTTLRRHTLHPTDNDTDVPRTWCTSLHLYLDSLCFPQPEPFQKTLLNVGQAHGTTNLAIQTALNLCVGIREIYLPWGTWHQAPNDAATVAGRLETRDKIWNLCRQWRQPTLLFIYSILQYLENCEISSLVNTQAPRPTRSTTRRGRPLSKRGTK